MSGDVTVDDAMATWLSCADRLEGLGYTMLAKRMRDAEDDGSDLHSIVSEVMSAVRGVISQHGEFREMEEAYASLLSIDVGASS